MRLSYVIFGVMLFLVSGCNSGNKNDIYVFKSTLKNDSILLEVDNREIGQIPFADTILGTNITAHAILFRLSTGKHEISAKDKDGNYLSSILIDIDEKDINVGHLSYKEHNSKIGIVNLAGNKYSFKNRSSKGLFIFSLD